MLLPQRSGFTSPPPTFSTRAVYLGLILFGFLLRLWAASRGDNYDMESWWISSEALASGGSIYSATTRYNYGPLWGYVLIGLRYLSALLGEDSIRSLHYSITLLLSLTDLFLASLLFGRRDPTLFFLFFLNPVSIIISGYHVQFDNLAILIALLAWQYFKRSRTLAETLIAGGLLGISLSTKHVFSIFLAWLPFITGVQTLKTRLLFGGVALLVFVSSFFPWIDDPASWAGIQGNVVAYKSYEGHSLVSLVAQYFPMQIDRAIFMALMVLTGALVLPRKHLHSHADLLYLIAITALSSGMARNYLAIPLGSLLSVTPLYVALPYIVMSVLALTTTTPGLGSSEVVAQLNTLPITSYPLLQSFLLALVVALWLGKVARFPSKLQ